MTFAQLSAIFEPVNHQRRIIGFDTFAGFAGIAPEDEKGESEFLNEGALAVDSHDDLLRCIDLFDANRFLNHIPKVSLVRGDINDTLPDFLEKHPHTLVSLLYLDVDIYQPTKVAIENLVPRMPQGAILAFDQLNDENWPGETLAVLETLGVQNLRIQRFPFGSDIAYAVLE